MEKKGTVTAEKTLTSSEIKTFVDNKTRRFQKNVCNFKLVWLL